MSELEQLIHEYCSEPKEPAMRLWVCYDRGYVLHLVRVSDDSILQYAMGNPEDSLNHVAASLLLAIKTRGFLALC